MKASYEFILGASVTILENGKVLMIKENNQDSDGKWKFPSGRIRYGDDIVEAARRKANEQTGFNIKITMTTGAYRFSSPANDQVIMFHFLGEIIGSDGKSKTAASELNWISLADLTEIDKSKLRNPAFVKRVLSQINKQSFFPSSMFKSS